MTDRDYAWVGEQIQDAIEDVHYRFELFSRAGDVLVAARELVALQDAVFALATWHDSFDSDSGTLGWQREDEVGGDD